MAHRDADLGDIVPHFREVGCVCVADGQRLQPVRMPSEWWKRYESVHFVLNDEAFQMGEASGDGCNCLNDTLRQSLGLVCNVTAIRRLLHRIHPDLQLGEFPN